MPQIAVIGAGLMGHGIALSFARAGHAVTVWDPVAVTLAALPDRITQSLQLLGAEAAEITDSLARVRRASSLADCVRSAEMVFEAAPEKLPLKQELFAEIEQAAAADCLLASNTSVMPITKIMEPVTNKARAMGTHWWNPPFLIPLVEVVAIEQSDPAAIEKMIALLESIGKTAVAVKKDIPGFIGNRLQHALWREAIALVANGVCDAEAVDKVVKSSFGRRLAVLGPLENADLVGTDLTLDIHRQVLFDLDRQDGPSDYLKQLVETGKLGMKTGEGFRSWKAGEPDAVRARMTDYLLSWQEKSVSGEESGNH